MFNGRPHMTRAVLAALHADFFTKTPALATIRSKSQQALTADMKRSGEIKCVNSILDGSTIRTRVVNRDREKAVGVMESAKIVIGGGLGLGGLEGFKTLNEIAELVERCQSGRL